MVDTDIRKIGATHDHGHLLADAAEIGRVEGDAEECVAAAAADAQEPGKLFGGHQRRKHADAEERQPRLALCDPWAI